MKTLAIVGSGDLGQQIAHYAISDNHYTNIVFIDDYQKIESVINGYKVIGDSTQILQLFAEKKFDELILGIGYKHLQKRKELFELLHLHVPFGKIVHSTSWVDKTASVKEGCVIYPCCNIDANSIVQENTILNIACSIAHDTTIGKHCFLSPRVALAGFITINELCILGINSTVIDNIEIVSSTQIGAGTIVIKNINKSGLYVGNPHKFVR